MDAKLQTLCAQQIPGDTFRNLVVRADYSAQTFKHILAPVWFLSYTYGARIFQCAMNGVNGTIRGCREFLDLSGFVANELSAFVAGRGKRRRA